MSQYLYFNEFKSDFSNKSEGDLVKKLYDSMGEDLTKNLSKPWDEYSSRYEDKEEGFKFITDFVLGNIEDAGLDSDDRFELFEKLCGTNIELEGEIVGYLEKDEAEKVYNYLNENVEEIASKYLDLLLEVLNEALKKSVGIICHIG